MSMSETLPGQQRGSGQTKSAFLVLPGLRTMGWKYAAGFGTAVLASPLYMLPNQMTAASATLLPLTSLDLAVPYWPWTGWIYGAVYLFLVVAFVGMRDLIVATRFLYACLFTQVIAAMCFVAFPTRYPRELYPLPTDTTPDAAAMVGFFHALDAPLNCFPSLHVSTCVLCLAAFQIPPMRRWRWCADIASALLIVSTLTFKQHYLVDVFGGAVLGLAMYAIFFRWQGLTVTARQTR